MNLREFLKGNKDTELLWTLVVEQGWIQAGVWTIVGSEAQVIVISNPVAWEKDEDLISAADTALSSTVQALPQDTKEPNKVVFGVSASWVLDGQIKKERLESLKILCEKLTLKPAGFVTLPEAVSFYIKSQEGSPLTAVTVSPGTELTEVSVFRLGNLVGTTQVARSVSLFDDVVEGLSRFHLQDPIPSRFILFDGKEGDLEEAKQALMKGDWQSVSKIKLLHTPKVEILSSKKKVEAVSLGGATEIAEGVSKIRLIEEATKDIDSTPGEVSELGKSEDLDTGFVVGKDITHDQESESLEDEANLIQSVSQNEPETKKESRLSALTPIFAKVQHFWSGGKRSLFIGVSSFVLVAGGLFAFWWFYPKATVTIFISPQTLDQKSEVFVSPDTNSINFEDKILPGRVISTEQSGEKTSSTTGSKLVGEAATGEVEIRNVSGEELELEEGTVLIAGNGLEFVLDSSATVPANESTVDPGKKTVAVTADDIGPEYNLPKDELFKVGSYSKTELDAVSLGDFTGGASRQISAVSEEDRSRVLEELTKELEEKAQNELSASVGSDEFFIEGSITSESASQEYSERVGDEAESLKLSLTLKVEGVVVSKSDLFEFAQMFLAERVPSGYILRETQVEYSFSLDEYDEEENTYNLDGEISANLLPEIDTDSIARDIAGKYSSLAEEYFTRIPGFVRVQIGIFPRFPGRLGTLPRVVNNIVVEISADR